MDLPRLRSSTATRPLSPLPTSCPMGPDSDDDDTPAVEMPHVDSDEARSDNALGRLSPPPTARRRDKRAPTVTPRRLAQFFRPRSSTSTRARAHSRVLQELQSGGNNIDAMAGWSDTTLGENGLGENMLGRSIRGTASERLLLDIESDLDEQVGVLDTPSKKRLSEGDDMPAPKRRTTDDFLRRKRDNVSVLEDKSIDGEKAVGEEKDEEKEVEEQKDAGEGKSEEKDTGEQKEVQETRQVKEIREDQRPRRTSSISNIHAFFGSNRSVTRSLTANQAKGLSLNLDPTSLKPRVITRLSGQSAQLLNRELNFSGPLYRRLARPVADPRVAIAPFYSNETDSYPVFAYTPEQQATIPFSLAPCRKSPLVAIGDEQGCVRFLDISTDGTKCRLPQQRDAHNDSYNDDDSNTSTYRDDPERRIRSRVKVHDNAIMSLAFSHDDSRLATACGDRNGTILDVATQAMAVSLEGAHVGPMRQVTFQPGSAGGNVLATSDRNGCIQIWDLRYSTGAQPQHWTAHDPDTNTYKFRCDEVDHATPNPIATADRAHARTVENNTTGASVTALSWFSLAGREHILLSASEANASIRVWDTRFIRHHTHRGHSSAVPLSATRQPASHRWRSFGVTALALSDDATASRLYAVCRDSTVYAYSAAHLMLGTVPELNSIPARPRRSHVGAMEDPTYSGLGPIYGFRHPQLRTQTFYVKCALRPVASTGGAVQQVLAVGSSENCAVMFPTDDRFIRAALSAGTRTNPSHPPTTTHHHSHFSSTPSHTPGASGSFFGSFFGSSAGLPAEADVPIVHCGAALVGGHSREVTHMGWAAGGDGLVTASDDCTVRHWRADDDERARFLRTCGEGGGFRYAAGWADLGDFDGEE